MRAEAAQKGHQAGRLRFCFADGFPKVCLCRQGKAIKGLTWVGRFLEVQRRMWLLDQSRHQGSQPSNASAAQPIGKGAGRASGAVATGCNADRDPSSFPPIHTGSREQLM